ncbi:phosphoribosyl-AMP cyclohydrolase [Litorivicinus sp.]|nr:phosphoribosyl-AMP cyclohydrolase [Litorivicinus sp.]
MRIENEQQRQKLLDSVLFDKDGLIAAIAQDHLSKEVLMLAWMNREALDKTLKTGQVVYFSRSRQALWRKGETSAQTQTLLDIHVDCDKDAVLIGVQQNGVACHTGRASCFSWAPDEAKWAPGKPVITDPETLYGSDK